MGSKNRVSPETEATSAPLQPSVLTLRIHKWGCQCLTRTLKSGVSPWFSLARALDEETLSLGVDSVVLGRTQAELVPQTAASTDPADLLHSKEYAQQHPGSSLLRGKAHGFPPSFNAINQVKLQLHR